METVGEKIKRLRKEHGWTQPELAERVGIKDFATISKIELGKWIPGRAMAERLSAALGITPMELFGWEPSDGIPGEVASRMRNMSEQQQKIILAFAEFVQKGGLDGI